MGIRRLRGVRSISLLGLILILILGLIAVLMQKNMVPTLALTARLCDSAIGYHVPFLQAQKAHSFGRRHYSTLLRSEDLEHSTLLYGGVVTSQIKQTLEPPVVLALDPELEAEFVSTATDAAPSAVTSSFFSIIT